MPQHSEAELSASALYDLSGRIALVTGGGSGIGLMIAQGLAANGAKVYISGRRRETLEKAASSLSGDAKGSLHPIQMDVTDKASIVQGVKAIDEQEGKLHILVNNAGQEGPVSKFFNDLSAPEHKDPGTLGRALFENESFEQWSDLYRINTFSIFFVTMAFLGLLAKGAEDDQILRASVVNITSISAVMRLAQCHFAYNSGKAAASHLTRMMATEFSLKNIQVRVNAVAPGVYLSEMTEAVAANGPKSSAELTNAIGCPLYPIPAGRPGSAQEAAGAVLYLVSAAGSYTNGQELVIDGGYLTVNPSTR